MDLKEIKIGNDVNHFWFRARRKFLRSLMNKHLKNRDNKILVIGAGAGDDLHAFEEFGDMTVTDVNPEVIEYLQSMGLKNSRRADARKLSFEDESFDCIFAFDVIEHIDDDQAAVSEIFRVLKKNGKAFFTVPAYQWLFSGHDVALEHHRRYSGKSFKKLLKNQKFEILDFGFWNVLLFPLALVKRLLSSKKKAQIDQTKVNSTLDKILFIVIELERSFYKKKIRFPFGLTIFTVTSK